jgi:outer membrane protein TolC
VSGLDLMLELPRPGELDAKTDVAFWRNKKLRQAVLEAEWRLARQVQAACVELEIAQLLLAQSTTLLEVTDRSRDYFAAAVEVGAATATEASLAAADSLLIRADSLGQESRMRRGRRDLNGLLGLPPEYLVPLAPRASWGLTGLDVQLEELQMEALEQRPDLWVAEAHYEVAEAELQLEIALQFPRIAIGTGLQISPGFPGGFNRAAIESATRRRAVAASELALEVHQIRAEVFDAQADYLDAKALCAMLKTELVANAEASLAHAQAAFEAGQVTLLETLNVQRSLVAAHTRLNAARADELRAATNLLTVTGRLSGTTTEQPR